MKVLMRCGKGSRCRFGGKCVHSTGDWDNICQLEGVTILAYEGEDKKVEKNKVVTVRVVVIVARTDGSPIPTFVMKTTADKYKDVMEEIVKSGHIWIGHSLPLKVQCEAGKPTYRNFITGGNE